MSLSEPAQEFINPTGAPCGTTLAKFVCHLLDEHIAAGDLDAIVANALPMKDKIEFALTQYDEERHWNWTNYRAYVLRRIDGVLGVDWKRATNVKA